MNDSTTAHFSPSPRGRGLGGGGAAGAAAALLRHPILWVLLVLIALTIAWDAIGAPVSLITQIAIYTLYGAGVNLLVGYTGLVPFGASVFFGCASYAAAISMRSFLGNEIEALVFAVAFSLLLAAAIALIILRRRGLYFSLLTLAFSQIAFEIVLQMDRPHRRRERPARRASAVAGQRLVVPHLHRDHRDPRHVAAMAHRSRAIRPCPPGAARQ